MKPERVIPLRTTQVLMQAVFVMSLLSWGCTAVGPDFKKPSMPVPDNWVEAVDERAKTEPADYTRWWSVFNDPALDRVVETARKQNPSLQIAGLRVLEARAQLGIARGNQLPQQQVSAGYTYSQSSKNAANTTAGDLEFQSVSTALDASWELDFWGKYRRAVESANANLLASVADYDYAMVTLIGDTASTYALIRILEERLQVARTNLAAQTESYNLVNSRYRNGAVTELDFQQARTLLLGTQASIEGLEISHRQAQHALSILLGLPPGDLQELLGGPAPIPDAPSDVVVGIPAELLRRRPDIRSAELQAAAQSAQIGVAKADLFPRVVLTGSFGFLSSSSPLTRTAGSNLSDLFNWRSFTMATGPTIEWPILNYGRITGNVRVQDARFQQLLMNYQNTVLLAAREVEDSLVAFLRGKDQVAFLTEGVAAAQRATDLSLFQYREGAVDYSRVLTAQQALIAQQDQLAQNRGSVTSNLIALYKALGGGWETERQKGFVSEEIVKTMRERTNWGGLLPVENPGIHDTAASGLLLPRPDW